MEAKLCFPFLSFLPSCFDSADACVSLSLLVAVRVLSGAIMQSSAGWDWIASTADRNTGLWDRVALEALVATARMPRRRTKSMKTSIAAAYRLSDALVSTASIDGHAERGEALRGATLRPSVKINPVLHPSSAAHADGPSAAAISILLVMRAFDEAHRAVALARG